MSFIIAVCLRKTERLILQQIRQRLLLTSLWEMDENLLAPLVVLLVVLLSVTTRVQEENGMVIAIVMKLVINFPIFISFFKLSLRRRRKEKESRQLPSYCKE